MASPTAHKKPLDAFESPVPDASSPRTEFSGHDWGRGAAPPRFSRQGSTSTINSVGGSLDMSRSKLGPVADSGQNAISTLLQPPIVRTGLLPHTSAPASATHRPPSSRDIPPVTLANVPSVDSSFIKSYLKQVTPLFDSRSRIEIDQPSSQWIRRERSASVEEDSKDRKETSQPGHRRDSRTSSRGSISANELPPLPRRRSSGGTPRRGPPVTQLSTIPQVYFDENFHLENPRTFDVVTERSEVVRTPAPPDDGKGTNGAAVAPNRTPRKALATNAILQEKLSWYLDTVEIHLIASISGASKSFFAALGSLKELHSEASESVTQIKKLRKDLAHLDQDMALSRLEIVRMKQRRANVRKLRNAVSQLETVMNGAAHCEELVDNGELEKALDRMAVLEEYTCGHFDENALNQNSWLCSEPPEELIDLRQLRSLETFGAGMDQLRARIGDGYKSRFMEALLKDLRNHITDAPNSDTLRRWATASYRSRGMHLQSTPGPPAYLETNSSLRLDLSATLAGLQRSKYTAPATAGFRSSIMREMKAIIRQNLPSSSDDDSESVMSMSTRSERPLSQQEKSGILARNLRALGPDDAEGILSRTYCAVGEALRRLQVQVKLLLDVTSVQQSLSPGSSGVRSPQKSPRIGAIDAVSGGSNVSVSNDLQEEIMQALDLSSLLGEAVDTAQSQLVKVLKVRSEQTARLSLPYFLRYFTLNRLFADECEAISGRSGTDLKGVINGHIVEFLRVMTDTEKQLLADRMDADRWESRDFSDEDNAVLSKVLEGVTSDPASWLRHLYVWEDPILDSLNTASKPASADAPITNGTSPVPNGKDAPNTTSSSSKTLPRPAMIDTEPFNLVSCTSTLLRGISNFLTLIACIPNITPEVSSSLLDYLRLFNSRSCQLILGTGATRTAARLEKINTKHLALASQSLAFVCALIPYIREFLRRRPGMSAITNTSTSTGGGGGIGEFDGVKRLCQEHQARIHDKLVGIMGMRAGLHVEAMRRVDWDAEAAEAAAASSDDAGGPSKHMVTLTKETGTLNRVLTRHLPAGDVRMIMQPVFANYREVWGRAFAAVEVRTEGGRRRLLKDAELFDVKLSALDGAGDIGAYIVGIAKAKTPTNASEHTTTTTSSATTTTSSATATANDTETNPNVNRPVAPAGEESVAGGDGKGLGEGEGETAEREVGG